MNETNSNLGFKKINKINIIKLVYGVFWYFHTWETLLFLLLVIFVEFWPVMFAYSLFFMISNVIMIIYVFNPNSKLSNSAFTKSLMVFWLIVSILILAAAILFTKFWYMGKKLNQKTTKSSIKNLGFSHWDKIDGQYQWFKYWDHDWDDYVTAIRVFSIILSVIPILHQAVAIIIWKQRHDIERDYYDFYHSGFLDHSINSWGQDLADPLISRPYRTSDEM